MPSPNPRQTGCSSGRGKKFDCGDAFAVENVGAGVASGSTVGIDDHSLHRQSAIPLGANQVDLCGCLMKIHNNKLKLTLTPMLKVTMVATLYWPHRVDFYVKFDDLDSD